MVNCIPVTTWPLFPVYASSEHAGPSNESGQAVIRWTSTRVKVLLKSFDEWGYLFGVCHQIS